jgi:hypothetical protein
LQAKLAACSEVPWAVCWEEQRAAAEEEVVVAGQRPFPAAAWTASLVMGGSITSAARDLGNTRRRVREMLQAARPYLEQSGFGNR